MLFPDNCPESSLDVLQIVQVGSTSIRYSKVNMAASTSSSTSSSSPRTNGDDSESNSIPTPSSPASSTSSLPPYDPSEPFQAPLGAELDREPSIDGTSIGAGSDYDPADSSSSANAAGNTIRKARLEDIDQDERAEALRIKSDANKLFTSSKYLEALQLYTLSLNKNPFDPAVWCNRAATRLKMEEHGLAIADATKAIELDGKYTKAYYRRAVAQLAIMRPKAAITDFKKVAQLDPKNVIAKQQLDSTQKLVRRLDFEKA